MLPEPGGARDQRPGELARLTNIYNIWRAEWLWQQREPGKEADWIRAHPAEWEIVQSIMEMEDGSS